VTLISEASMARSMQIVNVPLLPVSNSTEAVRAAALPTTLTTAPEQRGKGGREDERKNWSKRRKRKKRKKKKKSHRKIFQKKEATFQHM
jgi:hypothetical protein